MRNHLLLCAFLLVCGGLNAQTQLLGSPTTLVKNRGAFMSDSLLYIPKRSKTPADSGAIRYQISDSAIYVWTGSQWIKAGAGGTVTSITAGTGLSGGTITSSGTIAVDTATIATRARVQKGIDSLGAAKQNVLTNPVTGTGTTNYVAKFTGTSAVGNSQIYDDGGSIGIGIAPPTYKFDIRGTGTMVHSIKSNSGSGQGATYQILQSGGSNALLLIGDKSGQVGGTPDQSAALRAGVNIPIIFEPNAAEAMRLNTAGEMIVSSDGTDAGAYKFQVQGNIYNTTGAVFAASSGNVGIGTASPTLENNAAIKELTVSKIGDATNIATFNLQGDRAGDGAVQSRIATINFWQTSNNIARINGLRYNADNSGGITFETNNAGGGITERVRINQTGELQIGSQTDLGAYTLQNSGAFYNTGSAILAATSGSVGIGTSSPTSYTGYTTLAINNATNGGVLDFLVNGTRTTSIYTGGAGNAFWIQAVTSIPLIFSTNALERMRINPDGELLVNTTTDAGAYALQVAGAIYNTTDVFLAAGNFNNAIIGGTTKREIDGINSGMLHLWSNAGNFGGLTINGYNANNAFGNPLQFIKSRGTGNTAVQDGDQLGYIVFAGADGSKFIKSAAIWGIVDGATGTNDMPGRIEFATTSDGGTFPNERMRLTSSGELLINSTSDQGDYKLQVSGAIYNTTTITTGAPTSGTAKPWRLGEAATVSPTSPNRTIRVEIDGTVYYIHAKTTND